MRHLLDGCARFRETAWPERRALFERLAAQGQRPRTMVIACSDSRVDPAVIFDAGPGELFVARNVANMVPPCQPDGSCHGTSAALEFGCSLEVQDLIVMGHGLCGGIQALLSDTASKGDSVGPWMHLAERARRQVLAYDATRRTGNWPGSKPWIAQRVAAGTLRLHGAHFDVRSGVLTILQPSGVFAPVV